VSFERFTVWRLSYTPGIVKLQESPGRAGGLPTIIRRPEGWTQLGIKFLVGTGHAWRRGIPEQVRQRSEIPYKVILPIIPGKTDPKAATIDDSDYIWLEAK